MRQWCLHSSWIVAYCCTAPNGLSKWMWAKFKYNRLTILLMQSWTFWYKSRWNALLSAAANPRQFLAIPRRCASGSSDKRITTGCCKFSTATQHIYCRHCIFGWKQTAVVPKKYFLRRFVTTQRAGTTPGNGLDWGTWDYAWPQALR